MNFKLYLESVEYPNEVFNVSVSNWEDQPVLEITGWGMIRLFMTGKNRYDGSPKLEYYTVHMIDGSRPGAGSLLYFAALEYITKHTKIHWLASDSTLSPDALRARSRMQSQYKDYIEIAPHPEENIKVHRNDRTSWRRQAEPNEATMWSLKKESPFKFVFHIKYKRF